MARSRSRKSRTSSRRRSRNNSSRRRSRKSSSRRRSRKSRGGVPPALANKISQNQPATPAKASLKSKINKANAKTRAIAKFKIDGKNSSCNLCRSTIGKFFDKNTNLIKNKKDIRTPSVLINKRGICAFRKDQRQVIINTIKGNNKFMCSNNVNKVGVSTNCLNRMICTDRLGAAKTVAKKGAKSTVNIGTRTLATGIGAAVRVARLRPTNIDGASVADEVFSREDATVFTEKTKGVKYIDVHLTEFKNAVRTFKGGKSRRRSSRKSSKRSSRRRSSRKSSRRSSRKRSSRRRSRR